MTGDFSVEAWVRTTANSNEPIIAKDDGSAAHWDLAVSSDSGHVGEAMLVVANGSESTAEP